MTATTAPGPPEDHVLSGRRGPWARLRRATARDDGQILLLTLGYAVVALLVLTVVVSATGIHLERKRLLALADQSALAAATALDEEAYYGRAGGGGGSGGGTGTGSGTGTGTGPGTGPGLVRLTEGSVRDAVEAHLAASPAAGRLNGLRVVDVSTDGRTAHVTLAAVARPALVSVVTAPWSDGIALQVTAAARAG